MDSLEKWYEADRKAERDRQAAENAPWWGWVILILILAGGAGCDFACDVMKLRLGVGQ